MEKEEEGLPLLLFGFDMMYVLLFVIKQVGLGGLCS